jgi:hypothetical protein
MAENGHPLTKPIYIQSLVLMVAKKDGSLRVVQHFRELNAASHDHRYSMKTVYF